jgi:hypothetical protein
MTKAVSLKQGRRVRGGREMNPLPVPERGICSPHIHIEELYDMKYTFAAWLAQHRPLIGSDGDDDDDNTSDPKDNDDDASRKKAGAASDDDTKPDPKDGDTTDDDDEDDAEVTISAKELENLRQETARLKREQRKRDAKDKQDKEAKAREEGKHDEIAKEREEERDAEKAKREAAEFALDQRERDIRTRDAASNLNFREPEDAIRFLSDDDTETDDKVSKALKKLAEKKPYLLNDRPRSGRSANGGSGGNGAGLTMEEIRGMSTAQVAERMPEVQKALRAQQPTPAGGRT